MPGRCVRRFLGKSTCESSISTAKSDVLTNNVSFLTGATYTSFEPLDQLKNISPWTKTYPGSHDVHYRGFQEGKGIWGTWKSASSPTADFYIWPKGEPEEEMTTAAAEPAEAVDAIGKEQELAHDS